MKRRTFFKSTLAAAAATALPRHDLLAALYRPVTAAQSPPDIPAVTGDGAEVVLRGTDIAELAARMKGKVLLAGDDGYDYARRILNPSFDKHPALIAQVTGPADISLAVDFARERHGLLTAVKCGGHSASGKSTCDHGLLIDLSFFRHTRVDPDARRAWVSGGSLLGQLDHESMYYGLVTPMGTVSHTGVGGLVTGGGFGRLARRYGLSIDNLLAANVVTADGRLRRASPDENPDLFWGIRGGGGNFGVVTNFEFRLHPMQRTVVGGQVMFPLSRAKDLLRMYGDYGHDAPDKLQLDYVQVIPPGGGDGMAGFGVCWSGDDNEAEAALAPIYRAGGTPIADGIEAVDYVALQRSGDIDDPRAQGSYLKSGFVAGLPGGLIDAIVDGFEGHPARATLLFFQQSGGAIKRVDSGATAFSQRDVMANMLANVGWQYGDPPGEHIEWIRQYWSHLEPHTAGFYTNDIELDHSTQAIRENFRQNHERLVQVKNVYDPTNLFRLNANVAPTV